MRKRIFFACATVLSLAAASCGDDEAGTTTDTTPDAGDADDDESTSDDDVGDDDLADDDVADDDTDDDVSDDDADDDLSDDDTADDDVSDDDSDDDLTDDDVSDDDADDDLSDDDVSDDDSPPLDGFIGSEGGTLTTDDGLVLVIPENSIDPEGVLSAESAPVPASEGVVWVSGYWDLGPDGTTFDPPASLTLPFSVDAADGGEVVIYQYDEGAEEWSILEDCSVDDDRVTCSVEHFSGFAAGTTSSSGAGGSGGMSSGGSGGTPAGGTNAGGEGGTATGGVGGTGGAGGSAGAPAAGAGGTSGGSGGESVGGAGGTSGSGGTPAGGSSSGGSSSGGGGGAGSDLCYVPCWDEIDYAECEPSTVETCQFVGSFPNISGLNMCYDNGVKVQMTGITAEPIVMTWKKANGNLCYSLDITGAQTSTYSYTWKDETGAVVMTGTVAASNTDVVTYMCDGSQYVIDYSNGACDDEPRPAEQASCQTQGQTCTF